MLGSKPTVWDGDTQFRNYLFCFFPACSKPTVWDGDGGGFGINNAVCDGSKPTVWDGDLISRPGIVERFLCSKPTVWDGDRF